MNHDRGLQRFEAAANAKQPWVPPAIADLPALTDLTLASTIPIHGGGGISGGTVFS